MELIDRDELIRKLGIGDLPIRLTYDIENMPTVDAQPVVRCKECKFLRLTGNVWKCQNRLVMMLCEPNDYCSRAERKEE